jgi:hypothetical protein
MAKGKSSEENSDSGDNAVEEVESSYGAHADEIKQRPLDAQIGKGLMQALEDPICPSCVQLHVCHKPLVLAVMVDCA